MNKFTFESAGVFRHHQLIMEEAMMARVIGGMDGPFREAVTEMGHSPEEPTVGTVVQFTSRGEMQGCRVVKFGRVKPGDMNSRDFWQDAPEAKLVFPDFDLSIFAEINGMLTTPYIELPFKVTVKREGRWKVVKAAQLVDQGYGGLIARLNIVPISNKRVKFYVLGLPTSLTDLGRLGDRANSRGYPGIKIHQGYA